MHRSGTSMISGILHYAGVDFGKDLLPGTKDNRKGYFEGRSFYHFNERLLKTIGSSWHDTKPIKEGWQRKAGIKALKTELKKIIRTEYGRKSLFGMKDPRLVPLLPFYMEVFKELGINPCFVIVRRKPIEIYQSLKKRNGFSYEKTLALTEKYLKLIELYTRKAHHKFIIEYDDALLDYGAFLLNIGRVFEINFLGKSNTDFKKIDAFVSPRLKHHTISYDSIIMYNQKEIGQLKSRTHLMIDEISQMEKEIKQKEGEIIKKEGEINSKKIDIRRLNNKVGAIESSITWRLNRKLSAVFRNSGVLSKYLIKVENLIVMTLNKMFPVRPTSGHSLGRDLSVLEESAIARNIQSGSYSKANRYYKEKDPLVSIIILNFNQSLLTINCLHHVWSNVEGHDYEVIVVDNDSNYSEVSMLENFKGKFRLIKLGVNRFFGEANNIASEEAKGEYLVFLNNDAFVKNGWLEPLISCINHEPFCGACGSKLIYPDGRLQEAGAEVSADGGVLQVGKKTGDPASPEYNRQKAVDYCSASSLAVKKDIFMKVGGFDLIWEPLYYEDVDLCFKLKLLGLKTYYCPQSEVIHIESATSSLVRNDLGLHNIIEINKLKFRERWLSRKKFDLDRNNVAGGFSPRANLKNIILYSPYHIMMGGGERYIFTLASILSREHNVYIMSEHRYSRLRFRNIFKEMGLLFDNIGLITSADITKVGNVDLFFCLGNEVVPPYEPIGIKNVFICQFPFSIENKLDLLEKRRVWVEGYDRVVTYSLFSKAHYEKALVRYALGQKIVDVINPPVDVYSGEINKKKKTNMIISVGRFFRGSYTKGHLLMIDVFKKMIDTHRINAELHLVGALHPEGIHREYFMECKKRAQGYPVFFHTNASASYLESLYQEASIYWHATGADSSEKNHPEHMEHFGISIVEAMSYGCIPVVFGKGGPIEIVDDKKNGMHFLSTDELIEISSKLISGTERQSIDSMRESSVSKSKLYSNEVFKEKVLKLVKHSI